LLYIHCCLAQVLVADLPALMSGSIALHSSSDLISWHFSSAYCNFIRVSCCPSMFHTRVSFIYSRRSVESQQFKTSLNTIMSLSLPSALQTTEFIAVWLWRWKSKSSIILRRLISRSTVRPSLNSCLMFPKYCSSLWFPTQAQFSSRVKGNVLGFVYVNVCMWACMRVHAWDREIWSCHGREKQCVTSDDALYIVISRQH
jgi:hypothetical protein